MGTMQENVINPLKLQFEIRESLENTAEFSALSADTIAILDAITALRNDLAPLLQLMAGLPEAIASNPMLSMFMGKLVK